MCARRTYWYRDQANLKIPTNKMKIQRDYKKYDKPITDIHGRVMET
jgi:hypothetical protein